MRCRRFRARTALAIAVASAALLAAAPAAEAQQPGATSADIKAVVEQYRAAADVPGAAVTVTRGGATVHARGYGRAANGAPVTERTPMAVASVSKSFTALAVLQLAEQGQVDLDQPAQRYLPEFATADPRSAQITVRQLLDQTSGLSDASVPQFTRHRPATLRDSVADFRAAELASDPGTRWAYYNPNYQIAARLVEEVSGQTFSDYLDAHVFAPLGMADSTTVNTEDDLPGTARGHLRLLGHAVPVPEPAAFGAGSGGVVSTAADMAAWLALQNNAGPEGTESVISKASLDEMHRPASPESGDYALGWSVGRTPGGSALLTHGGDLFAMTAYQALLPDSGHGVAVMANTGTAYGDAQAIGERLVALLDGTDPEPPGDPSVTVDAVLLGLAAVPIASGAAGVVRAQRWAGKHARWRDLLLRLPPFAVPPLLLLFFAPIVGALYQGRDISWMQAVYTSPSVGVFLIVLSAAAAAVATARLIAVARRAEPGAPD